MVCTCETINKALFKGLMKGLQLLVVPQNQCGGGGHVTREQTRQTHENERVGYLRLCSTSLSYYILPRAFALLARM